MADDTDAMRALWMISHTLDDVAETVPAIWIRVGALLEEFTERTVN